MRRFITLFSILALLFLPTSAVGLRNERESVMSITEVATGTPVSVSMENIDHTAGYLIVKTENETATASMVVTVYVVNALESTLVCNFVAITTETTTAYLIGLVPTAAADEDVDEICNFPLSRNIKITFTTSGAGADFDVTATMEWVGWH